MAKAAEAMKPEVRRNSLLTRAIWEAERRALEKDPGRYHGEIAKREIHWFDSRLKAWITWSDELKQWTGFDAETGLPRKDITYDASHEPWTRAFNDDDPPFYQWFKGGLTNACFNEVDRHVLAGYGDEVAYYFEGDRWDPALHEGRGGPVVHMAISRKQLLVETVKAALVLESLGLKTGDRIALNMPNIMSQIYYTEAAKRLGIIYTPVFGGFSDKTLSDRIQDAGARVVLTADGSYRNAQLVPFKEAYSDPALDNFIAVETALGIVATTLERLGLSSDTVQALNRGAQDALTGEITVERADVLRGIGRVLEPLTDLDPAQKSRARTEVALALMDAPPRVEAVIVVRHTGQELTWRPERDRWAHELEAEALKKILATAKTMKLQARTEEELLALDSPSLIRLLYALSPSKPLDAEYPMFIIYTSGSTGKPKGVVHVHGGYVAGLAHTMKISFDARPGEDVIYVVADPGWITGQSYLISASLTTRTTGIITEGTPVFPHAGRFASIIERHRVTIFKAGVTFLKAVMSNPENRRDAEQYDMKSLRVATFCAEPVSPAVQQFGMELMCPQYINSYWATEHGGIVWTHFYGNEDFPLRPDAHTYPLPWVFGDVWVAEGTDPEGRWRYRIAEVGEKGEIVITRPYPYLARTIWGDAEQFSRPGWKGDARRYTQTYWGKWAGTWAYTQGDFAIKYEDGSFTLHGRSDDVINVSGHRLGTEEIEGAILRDRQLNPDSPVGNVIVVGAPHREKGLTPVAFVMTAPGRRLTLEDRRRLTELVRQEKGAVAIPSDFIEVSQFPETRSGKYMRRFLSNLFLGEPLGDTTTLKNPESLVEIRGKIETWRDRTRIEESQQLFEVYRYFRIQYHEVRPGERLAVVTVTNAPVNALNERALDELGTIVDHLARREEVRAVIFTGEGTASFVAGADIKQLLEEMHTVEDVLPLPKKAHLAFRKIEQMPKPVIAAVNGVALGGGNEFQMACHYRIAEPTARFGQPEIALRLLPGYGGTQRLPRLLSARDGARGLLTALEIMLHGRQIDPDEALAIGLIDEVADDQDALTRATTLAREYLLTGQGALARAFQARKAMMAEWENPQRVPEKAVNEDREISRLRRQTERAGRAKAAALILEVVSHGWERGFSSGIELEAQRFAEAVVDPEEGKEGILAFLEKRSAPLPTRRREEPSPAEQEALLKEWDLLPPGAPFFPGITPLPRWQYAWAAVKSDETGEVLHGDPAKVEAQILVPVERPKPNEVLCFILASEVNFNDVWAITGVPVSPFDDHGQDYHITGSGGVGLVAAVGSEVKEERRVKVGDLVVIYSGQSDLLSPIAGLDPMATSGFIIQGYQGPDGSHQQFMIAQAPQVFPKPPDLTLEAAGSYVLKLGTVYRALFTVLKIQPGKSLFVEGAATGTGYDALKTAALNGLDAFGLVSSPERARFVLEAGAKGVINRADPRYKGIFTIVPADPAKWKAWAEAGDPLLKDFRSQNGGRLADYVVSHAGEQAFPRSFQLLEPGGTLTFYGASSGYYFSFIGKQGRRPPEEILTVAGLRAGEAVLIYYGTETDADGIVDRVGLEAIEAAREKAARIVAVTYTDAQKEFVLSLGYGDAVKAVVSLAEIKRKHGENFDWPNAFPELPDPKKSTAAFKERIRLFNDRTLKPLGSAVGGYLRTPDNPRGYPDLIFERAGHDALGVSTALIKPFTGRVVYSEAMAGRRYTFFAPQVWMRQRRIYMATANIWGAHLSNAYEVLRMNEMVDTGLLEVAEPVEVAWPDIREAHQAIWENRHAGSAYVLNHALPRRGLKARDELFEAWAAGG
jgi:acrylyl-CoA reductase (NADPH)/3-hydroxypropionyl-CoA dehydratase/3-hydroxypropionyl-CoA synthetase